MKSWTAGSLAAEVLLAGDYLWVAWRLACRGIAAIHLVTGKAAAYIRGNHLLPSWTFPRAFEWVSEVPKLIAMLVPLTVLIWRRLSTAKTLMASNARLLASSAKGAVCKLLSILFVTASLAKRCGGLPF